MSVRYGISLTLEPAYTAGLHRARQVVCSQYGCWAAEMHAVHLPLTGYFPGPEETLSLIDTGLQRVAGEFRAVGRRPLLESGGLVSESGDTGSIYLEFEEVGNPGAVKQLISELAAVLRQSNIPGVEAAEALRFPLLQYAALPPRVFESAARFAEGVVKGLELAAQADPAELVLFRYESSTAGDDWSNGGWATDLSWQIVNAYSLTGAESK